MASTTVIIKTFENFIVKVSPFENLKVKITPFEDLVIVVPGASQGALLNEDGATPILSETGIELLVE